MRLIFSRSFIIFCGSYPPNMNFCDFWYSFLTLCYRFGLDEKPGYGDEDSNYESVINSSFVYNPYMSLDLQSQKNKLPITKYRNDVLYLCEKFQTLILVGSTGSGKSTQVSQVCFLYY